MLKKIALLCIVLLLTACLSPAATTPKNNYVLNTAAQMSVVPKVKAEVLLVSMPRLDAIMNNSQMLYSDGQHQVGYFRVHRWAGKPNDMLYPLLLRSVQEYSAFRSVVGVPYSGASDLQLDTLNFSIVQDFTVHPSVVRVKMDVRLSHLKPPALVQTRAIQAVVLSTADTPEAGVLAANQAVSQCLTQIVRFVNE